MVARRASSTVADAGDHKGPPRATPPPSPLRTMTGLLLTSCLWGTMNRPLPSLAYMYFIYFDGTECYVEASGYDIIIIYQLAKIYP